tara:strand:- start:95 stop:349 length:255 start_codon:yes stop_codon:yes gene_type:complete
MGSNFDIGNADELFTKIMEDESGRLRKLVNQIVQAVRAAVDMGCEPDELQMLFMVGYMSSKEPETRQLFDMLLKQTVPKDDDFH